MSSKINIKFSFIQTIIVSEVVYKIRPFFRMAVWQGDAPVKFCLVLVVNISVDINFHARFERVERRKLGTRTHLFDTLEMFVRINL